MFILYTLTVLMFLDCVLLIFLVLLQLPKKEAGMGGTAFGGAATDALFGAGSGNVLTKITKYVAGIFFVLAILMAWVAAYKPESSASLLAKKLSQGGGTTLAPSLRPLRPRPTRPRPRRLTMGYCSCRTSRPRPSPTQLRPQPLPLQSKLINNRP
jgi:preprotein translocase subunit SecG